MGLCKDPVTTALNKRGYNLVKLGFTSEEEITNLLSEQFGVPAINLRHFEIDQQVVKLIPAEVAQKYLIVPVNRTGATLTIAMVDPAEPNMTKNSRS